MQGPGVALGEGNSEIHPSPPSPEPSAPSAIPRKGSEMGSHLQQAVKARGYRACLTDNRGPVLTTHPIHKSYTCVTTAFPVFNASATTQSNTVEGKEQGQQKKPARGGGDLGKTTPLDTYVLGYDPNQDSKKDMLVIKDTSTLSQPLCQKPWLLTRGLPKAHSGECLVAPSSTHQESRPTTQLSDASVHLSSVPLLTPLPRSHT